MTSCLDKSLLDIISLKTNQEYKYILVLERKEKKKKKMIFINFAIDWHLVPNLYLNIKYEIVLFEKCQM